MSWKFGDTYVSNMCNKNSSKIEKDKTDLNMSFYENLEETATNNNSNSYNEVFKNSDCTSLDSGYGTNNNFDNEKTSFRDAGFTFNLNMEDFIELQDETSQPPKLPTDFNSLINANIVIQSPSHSSTEGKFKRHLSDDSITIQTTPSCVVKRPSKKFKTPETTEEPIKYNENLYFKLNLQSTSTVDLIGDYTQAFSLPVICGRHPDLKSITPTTLVTLIRGGFKDNVSSFKIIDCRYPYEFEGGHVKGAINLFTREQILEKLMEKENLSRQIGQVLVFHCEFSSERAPNLCRVLRELDRNVNQQSYPALYYPEIYLLEGGYKQFFAEFADFCVPKSYLPMRDSKYQQELSHYKNYCKGNNGTNGRLCLGKRLMF